MENLIWKILYGKSYMENLISIRKRIENNLKFYKIYYIMEKYNRGEISNNLINMVISGDKVL
jgi:hypothetical protein